MFIIKYIFIVSGRLQKRRPANGEGAGVVLKLRTFPDEGGGGDCENSDVRKLLKNLNSNFFSMLIS